jgi:hypothetical protein
MTICGCKKQAIYNYKEMKPKYCGVCKKEGMVNVVSKKCFCGKGYPIWNYDELKAEFCKECKKADMIDVKNTKCFCGKRYPIFNYEGVKAEFCGICKKADMVDVRNNKCYCGKSQPTYNLFGEKAEFCGICKKADMVDVRNPKCFCGKGRPTFNYEGMKAEFCGNCKSTDMVNVNDPKCFCGKGRPTFNYEGMKAEFCGNCKKPDMSDVIHKKCNQEHCDTLANPKYEGYCAYCFGHLFPYHPLSAEIRTKSKEIITTNYIKEQLPAYEFRYDKQLEIGGCDCSNRRRPDAYKLINETILCVEVDEFQHKNYNKEDEDARINDLYMAHSGKWVYIRFNPDNYKKNNETIKTSINTRLPNLLKEILKQIKRIENGENIEPVEQIQLYFDK